ncbi:MAG: hypothetical protein DRO52_00850 [Candidatus Hecatellales archaeon]|nr:MAG: hypothetical protein DRO52_00850 [Candidatus Hecatellales archaeon]
MEIRSPLSGKVLSVKVKVGEAVKKGQVLLIIDAMKMENEIISPSDGTVKSVKVSEGSTVNSGDLLIELD